MSTIYPCDPSAHQFGPLSYNSASGTWLQEMFWLRLKEELRLKHFITFCLLLLFFVLLLLLLLLLIIIIINIIINIIIVISIAIQITMINTI